MRISTSLSYILSASVILAFAAGCSGSGTGGGTSALAPLAQTPSGQSTSASGKVSPDGACPVEANNVRPASAASFAVLGGSTVTSTGLTVLDGNLGVSPGTSITGFPPGIVNGTIYAGGPVAAQAQADLVIAYGNAAARPFATPLPADIGGMTITPGMYVAPTTLGISGTVTLDGQNNTGSTFIFQIPSTLTTAVNSKVKVVQGANACNIFWQVGSSATLDTNSHFKGTLMAAVSVSLGTGARVVGRILTEGGAVTLLDNSIKTPHGHH